MSSLELYLINSAKFHLSQVKEKLKKYSEKPEEPEKLQGKQGRLRLDTQTGRRKKQISQ